MSIHTSFVNLSAVLLMLGLVRVAGGQSLTVGPAKDQPQPSHGLQNITPKEVQERRREYSEAEKDYEEKNDRTLFEDIVNHPENQAEQRARLQNQKERDRKRLDAQAGYYKAIQSLYRQTADSVSKPMAATSREDDKKRLTEVSTELFEQRQRLQQESTQETNPLIRTQYDSQIAHLQKAEDANKAYQILLDSMAKNDADIAAARAKAIESQKEMDTVFESLVRDTQLRAAERDKMYDTYSGAVGHRTTSTRAPTVTAVPLPPADRGATAANVKPQAAANGNDRPAAPAPKGPTAPVAP